MVHFAKFIISSRRFIEIHRVLPIFMRLSSQITMSSLEKVQNVDIDTGKFKYILIKVHHSPPDGNETSKYIVRGYTWAPFHGDIYDKVAPPIEKDGLDCECVGGGRIIHTPDEKSIQVYGYSQGFGKADHSITCNVLKTKYPEYEIKFSDEGY